MIVEFVQFTYPPGLTREQILEDARTTIPRWRSNKELVRKHYIVGDDGSGGAFYIWPSKEAAQRGTTPNGSPISRRAPARCRPSAIST
jgi:hypothetical protein